MSTFSRVKKENEALGRGHVSPGEKYGATVRDLEPVSLELNDVFIVPKRTGEGVSDVDKELRKPYHDIVVGNDGVERKANFTYVKLVPQTEMTDEQKAEYEKDPEIKKVFLRTFDRSMRKYDEKGRPIFGDEGRVKASGTAVKTYQEHVSEDAIFGLDAISGKKIIVSEIEYARNQWGNYQPVLKLDFVE